MTEVHFAEIDWRGCAVRVEYQWVGRARRAAPLLVFLHEGLGCAGAWRDFPRRVCDAAQARGLVFSRPGYGRSSPGPSSERWAPDFMHQQAYEVLPALLQTLGIDARTWLFGHSDGASIALIHAARFPERVAGLIALAPHIFVEEYGLQSIRRLRHAYLETDLKSRLARIHDDVDATFWSWNRIWLDPAFERWTIEQEITSIRCPVLAIQGLDDEYGTLEQIRGIARRVPGARLLELAECGHLLHRDQPDRVIQAAAAFLLEANRCDSTDQPSS